jgi:protocatechuate 3,4-dioxygenase beta subunit
MKNQVVLFIAVVFLTTTGCTQTSSQDQKKPAAKKIGGSCEGCEAIFESPVSFDKLKSMVWLPDWNDNGRKLAVNGTVYKADGKTPAPNVILYIYHTDQKGEYPSTGNEKGWGKRHGYLRGWLKTDDTGFYKFFTLRPAAYPGGTTPAHIHIIVKEPDNDPYWIDEFVFDDDPLLTKEDRGKMHNRGGNGILKFRTPATPSQNQGPPVKSERDIYLGRNIENYPKL